MVPCRYGDDELDRLCKACEGRSLITLLEATGMRLSELAWIEYRPNDPERIDLDLTRREVRRTVRAASNASSGSNTAPRKRGATQLGFALLLKFFAIETRFPRAPDEVRGGWRTQIL